VAGSTGQIKRTLLNEYPRKGRATGGVATLQLPPRSTVAAAAVLSPGEDVLLISDSGKTARVIEADLPLNGRDRKGSTALKLDASDPVVRAIVLPA
jgi:DNA gyrase subunit A